MSSNIILECRQYDSPSSVNGVYESYLANEIVINDGDILLLKSAFIDTKKEGNIIIEDDLILTMNYGVYMTDWIEDIEYKREYIDIDGNDMWAYATDTDYYKFGDVYNGKRYIPYYFKSTTGVEYQQVNSVTYKALGQVFGEQSPSMSVTYQYTDALTNQVVVTHSTIPASEPNVVYTDVLGFLIVLGSFSILSPSMRDMETDYYWKFVSQDITTVPSDGVYSPYIFTKTFTLPAGIYSPNNLALLISKLMSTNNINGSGATISNDSFVKYVNQFLPGEPFPNGAPGNINDDGTYFFSDDMTTRFRFYVGSPNYTFGASQTELAFDLDSNLFSFQYLHSPIYDLTTGTNISVRIANIGVITSFNGDTPVVSNNYIKTTDNGGIFFTGLQAKIASTGVPFDFWKGILGFDLSQITVKPRKPVIEPATGSYFDLTGSFYSYFLNPNLNITSGYSGVDASIIKKISPNNWYTLSSVGVPAPGTDPVYRQQPAIFSTIDQTTPLIAYIPYNELLDTFSHYIIDADLKFIGNYVGRDKYNNIQGTVSKYYQVSNYVVSDGEGGIQYTHRGVPLILKSIKINILKSNKTVDINLGPDNTIIFQLIKSIKPPS